MRADTPQARNVRSIGSRCSNASPIAELTMNRPTTERQQAERRQVEMKTVGEAFEIALRIRLDQPEFVAGDVFERRALAFGFADQQPGNLIRHFQQPLRDADIDHQHAGHQLRLHAQRRQRRAAARRAASRLPAD